jgi:hypothetical protein
MIGSLPQTPGFKALGVEVVWAILTWAVLAEAVMPDMMIQVATAASTADTTIFTPFSVPQFIVSSFSSICACTLPTLHVL